MSLNRFLLVLLILTVTCVCALAQTGATLQGTLTDASEAAVPNVQVELKSVATGAVRTTVTTSEGIFRFSAVAPGVYDMTAKPGAGFKEYTQRQITLNVSEIRELGHIALQVGSVTESVEVTAAATPVQTASSEHASMVDFDQMKHITVRGRDLMSMLQTLPGVNMGNNMLTGGGSGQGNNETVNPFALGQVNINGMGSAANYTVDGVTGMDMAGDSLTTFSPNVDAVAEVRVLSTNYQAEFGRNIGGQIQVITKSGTSQYHGSANLNKRHEMFNANSFDNNFNGRPKNFYRFIDFAYTIGGPVQIPKLFTRTKNKVFFFVSQDYLGQRSNPATGYANVPNPNQRKGDFSYYASSIGNFNSNSLRNPLGGANSGLFTPWSGVASGVPYGGQQNFAQYLGNFDANSQKWGAAMMAALPLPNLCNASAGTSDGNVWNGIPSGQPNSNLISPGNCPSWITSQATGLATGNIDQQGGPGTTNDRTRNYYWRYDGSISRRNDIARLDLNLTSKLTAYVRFGRDHFVDNSPAAIPSKNVKTGLFEPTHTPHPNPGMGWSIGTTYTITPTMINSLTLGYSWNDYAYDFNADQLSRANMAANIGGQLVEPPSFHNFKKDPLYNQPDVKRPESPDGQPYYKAGYPSVSFGGGLWSETGVGQPFCNGTCPNYNYNPMYSVTDSVSKTVGAHNFKAGVYWEWNQKIETSGGNSQGTYNFSGGTDPFFGANTMDGLANAFLGNLNSYSEGQRVVGYKSSQALEAFVQDSWRVARHLTLDLGVRFSHLPAMQDVAGNSSAFLPSTYKAAEAERIFYPYCTVSTATAQCPSNTLTTIYQYQWDRAMNPNAIIGTGQGGPGNMYPSYLGAGTLVPATFNGISTGGYTTTPNPYTGYQRLTWDNPNYPLAAGMYQVPKFAPAFRFGFAWDVFGNGKTAIRGGFGQNLRRLPNSLMNGRVGSTTVTQTMTQNYGTIASVANNPLAGYTQDKLPNPNQMTGLGVPSGWVLNGYQKYQSSYNGSFEIQQDVGFSTVVQAAWVFNLGRHSALSSGQNNVTTMGTPMGNGALWNQLQPAALNPLSAYLDQWLPGNANGRNYSDNYFRTQYPGYSGITINGFGGSSDYHSLQASVRRNFTKRFSYSFSFTWAKTMSLNGRSDLFPDKYRNWGPSYNPTPMYAVLTYVYQIPDLGKKLNFKPLGWVTDNWEWSGMSQLRGEAMTGIFGMGFSTTNSTNLSTPSQTGTSGEGGRMNIVGDFYLPKDQVSFVGGPTTCNATTNPCGVNGTPGNQIFNNAAVMTPNPCSLLPASQRPDNNPRIGNGQTMSCFGNAGSGSLLKTPGTSVSNWDMTFRKKFPMKSERRLLEFRAEVYNIFNHTQFLSANTGQNYDWANYKNTGTLVPTNGNTGRYNTGNMVAPRIMSMALRFEF